MNPIGLSPVAEALPLILRAALASMVSGIRRPRKAFRSVSVALAAVLFTLVAACASTPSREESESRQAILISGIVIRNELAYPVTEVMIEAPATRNFAGCGTVLPRSECSNTFQLVGYRGNPLVVRWKEHGQPHQTDEFKVHPPSDAGPGDEFRIEVIVFAPGQAGARLVEGAPEKIRYR